MQIWAQRSSKSSIGNKVEETREGVVFLVPEEDRQGLGKLGKDWEHLLVHF